MQEHHSAPIVYSILVSSSQFRLYSFCYSASPSRWDSLLPATLYSRLLRPWAPACRFSGKKTCRPNKLLLHHKARQEQTRLAIPTTMAISTNTSTNISIDMAMVVTLIDEIKA